MPQQQAQQQQSKPAVADCLAAGASSCLPELPSTRSPLRADGAEKLDGTPRMGSAGGDRIHADGSAAAAAATAAAATQLKNVSDAYTMARAASAAADPQQAAQRAAAAANYRNRFRDDTAGAETMGSAAAGRFSLDTLHLRPPAAAVAAAAASRFSLDTSMSRPPHPGAAADMYSSLLFGIAASASSTELPAAAARPAAPAQRSAFAMPAAQQQAAPSDDDYMAACGGGRLFLDRSATPSTLDDILEDPAALQSSGAANGWHASYGCDAVSPLTVKLPSSTDSRCPPSLSCAA